MGWAATELVLAFRGVGGVSRGLIARCMMAVDLTLLGVVSFDVGAEVVAVTVAVDETAPGVVVVVVVVDATVEIGIGTVVQESAECASEMLLPDKHSTDLSGSRLRSWNSARLTFFVGLVWAWFSRPSSRRRLEALRREVAPNMTFERRWISFTAQRENIC